ncbi:uncharacterized protein LACBIDRAFT_302585 [Laccaria bicolor S238N-H82]|uniref:Predicted protein n=1 Tax=Laccaria bicolor (strain S238N-H82 / ATCC MYA-4686) TaxID=486041 RepID=B0DHY2_LACBS|nr:uncharacterized protein LACBIDRAFT_302585 [Laccaria bicolor S238N-H82]EDR05912.1 predicted protein [Laccaria bicolor S238N-H82]|eukprot:XP_001883588.1 predicted protein [Laccaria bicolor S238N-H82]
MTTNSHHEHLRWAKRPVCSHIDHHLMHWMLSNNIHNHGTMSTCYVDGAWRQRGTSNAIVTPANHCHITPLPSATFGVDNTQ